jgi:thioredoxin-like negative regulator of GroEL
MRKLNLAAILIGVLASVGTISTRAAEPTKAAIQWQAGLDEAHRLSLEQKKPMLLVFGAPWCHYCKKLEQTTLTNPDLVRYVNGNFVAVHIDVDEQQRVAKILEVESLPCTIVLSPDADLLGRFEGYKQPSEVYAELSKARRALEPAVRTASKTGKTDAIDR